MIAAGIVTYNPDIEELQENYMKYIDEVEILYIYDNASDNVEEIEKLFIGKNKVKLVKGHDNKGIAYALNRIMEKAEEDGVQWVLTMDQDSICQDDIINALLPYCDDSTGIVHPYVIEVGGTRKDYLHRDQRENVKFCITSASLTNVNVWKKVGGFDEWMFIDFVDNDFCAKIVEAGYKIVQINNVFLFQKIGQLKEIIVGKRHIYIRNYSASRKYYYSRNILCCNYKHPKTFPFTLMLRLLISTYVKVIFFENAKAEKVKRMNKGIIDGKRRIKELKRIAGVINNMDSTKIKILFISHESGVGGSTVSLVSLIHGLEKVEGMNMDVLLPDYKIGDAFQLLEKNGITYKKIWYRRNFKTMAEPYFMKYRFYDFMNKIAVGRISRYIKRSKFDIVCSNSTGVDVGAGAAKLAGVPHIYYAREIMEDGCGCEYRNKKRMKALLEHSEYVIFISKTTEEYYTSNFILENTSQFFDGFILKDYYIENHDILKGEAVFFVQVGAFAEGKGTINTIELLNELKRNGITDWHMEFVGNGTKEYVEKMRELITKYQLESQITIGEYCPDIKKKLSQKDILIMNSRAEGFGRVTVEGMLAGCLVIGRYAGGTTEIIIDEVNGMTFGTKEEFTDVIHRVMSERGKYRELARKGQKYAMDKFDCTGIAENFMKVVHACLNQKEK